MSDAPERNAALLAVDWGTTAFRAWLLDDSGAVTDRVTSADGSLRVSERADSPSERAEVFRDAFVGRCGPWLTANPGVPVLAAGMVGSDHGWAGAGYLDVPADLRELAGRLTVVPAGESVVHLVPGLRVTGPDPDVMRGEEVQLRGVLAATTDHSATVVLPGTHTKWVRLDGGCVTGFTTAMTGELYGLLLRDSTLSRLAARRAGPEITTAFTRGLEAAERQGDERGLGALLFTARTLALAGRLESGEVADYVSGLLVGDEVRHALQGASAGVVTVCGSPSTAPRYRHALERAGVSVRTVEEDVAALGLWRIAQDAGLVPAVSDPRTEDHPR
ncbi:2-dehydro-3-deoxygalactonokinase [Myceligenerans pegani]|uniref:2-dehydro-3-deoxygalactonokinase n=1 Tax=Myceligenerans pegani TaxID=2776917 RepID=A0ABR9MWB4_9MICO|nr:2-dehydro-3-deoxygalactonokinase [Myceligenerans sp. TRM 65318]MBE1875670.1 2-dehydro-3-deoxygalactonokinase [Myceligenerans sp. TRM 65318]MBE3017941.1 2-dehydro-3-deoxygalactonokinase [Myceligenerans sp. TRM 65318]